MKAFKVKMPITETEEIIFVNEASVYSTADNRKKILEVGRKIDDLMHVHAKLGALLVVINEGKEIDVTEAIEELKETITGESRIVLILISMLAKVTEK